MRVFLAKSNKADLPLFALVKFFYESSGYEIVEWEKNKNNHLGVDKMVIIPGAKSFVNNDKEFIIGRGIYEMLDDIFDSNIPISVVSEVEVSKFKNCFSLFNRNILDYEMLNNGKDWTLYAYASVQDSLEMEGTVIIPAWYQLDEKSINSSLGNVNTIEELPPKKLSKNKDSYESMYGQT